MKKVFNLQKLIVLTVVFLLLGTTSIYAASKYGFDNRTGVNLHYIEADASDIDLKATGGADPTTYMKNNGYASGINGGFFYRKDLLSIAIVNDRPAGYTGDKVTWKTFYEYGNGGANVIGGNKTAGTIIWDGDKNELKLEKLYSGWEIHTNSLVTNTNNYWAQGGASLSLHDDNNWQKTVKNEGYDRVGDNDYAQRSAMLISWDKKKVYLIVTDSKCTCRQFRTAIKKTFTWQIDHGMDGIFLDGSTCSQLRYNNVNKVNHSRCVNQVIVLK